MSPSDYALPKADEPPPRFIALEGVRTITIGRSQFYALVCSRDL